MRLITALFLLLIISGCATGEKSRDVQAGMSEQEVVSILGKPDGYSQRGEYTVYKYTNRLISGWSWDRADYTFIFNNNKLVEYGPGEVREKNIGGVHTLFIHNY